MPKGPMGAPRPGAKCKLVLMVNTEEKVGIEEDPRTVREITESIEFGEEGPGFPPDTVEPLEGGTSGGVFSEYLGGEELDPVQVSNTKGVFITFGVPSLTARQIEETKAAIQAVIDTKVEGHAVAVL